MKTLRPTLKAIYWGTLAESCTGKHHRCGSKTSISKTPIIGVKRAEHTRSNHRRTSASFEDEGNLDLRIVPSNNLNEIAVSLSNGPGSGAFSGDVAC